MSVFDTYIIKTHLKRWLHIYDEDDCPQEFAKKKTSSSKLRWKKEWNTLHPYVSNDEQIDGCQWNTGKWHHKLI